MSQVIGAVPEGTTLTIEANEQFLFINITLDGEIILDGTLEEVDASDQPVIQGMETTVIRYPAETIVIR